MGLATSTCDNGSFASKGDVTYKTIACANWPPPRLHQIGAMVHVPMDLAIDAALAYEPYTNLLGPFNSTYADAEPLRILNTIYLPAPFVGLFLKRDLTPADAWTRLCGAIVEGGQEVGCSLIIDWI